MWIPHIHWKLINRLEPRAWKLATETIVTKQHIGDSLAFRSRKPGGNQGLYWGNIWLDHDRTAGDDDNNTFHSSTDIINGGWAGVRDCQIQAVSISLCVWELSYYNNGVGEFVCLDIVGVWVLLVDYFGVWINGIFNGIQDCGTCSLQGSYKQVNS